MPHDAITHVSHLGWQQGMPKSLIFTNQYGFKLPDVEDAIDDDHDSNYDPANDDASTSSYTSSYSSHSDDYYDNNDDDWGDNIAQPLPGLTTGVDDNHNHEADDSDHSEDDNEDNDDDDNDDEDNDDEDNDDYNKHTNDVSVDEDQVPEINIPDAMVFTPPATPSKSAGVGGRNTGVWEDNLNVHAQDAELQNDDALEESETSNKHNQLNWIMDEQYGARLHNINLQDHKPRSYDHLYDPDHMLATFKEPMGELFMMEQMSLKKGLKHFGKNGADALVAEMRQLDYLDMIKPVDKKDLTCEQKCHALGYLMYLKQKWCGQIKARGCADGRKQQVYKSKDKTSSLTVTTKAVFLTAVINAQECQQVMTFDIPGAFMQVDIAKLIHMWLEGPMAKLLTWVNPEKYWTYMSEENGKQVLYVKLQ